MGNRRKQLMLVAAAPPKMASADDRANSSLSNRRLSVCVVGSGGVGKSSITLRYINGHFPEFYDPTIEESYMTQIEYGFHVHDVEIVDTAGQEEFLTFRDSSMTQGDAFLMVFAIDSISSWQHLKELRTKIVQEKDDSQIPMVIVANKRDLESDRQVQLDDTLDYCYSIDCPLIEASAKTGLNIAECFRMLMERVEELRPQKFQDSKISKEAKNSPRTSSNKGCRTQ